MKKTRLKKSAEQKITLLKRTGKTRHHIKKDLPHAKISQLSKPARKTAGLNTPILFLDTADAKKISVTLIFNEWAERREKVLLYGESYKILDFVQSCCTAHKLHLKDFKKIIIRKGAGSFTGLRVGAAIALGIHASFGTPIYVISETAIPENVLALKTKKLSVLKNLSYNQKPNITPAKKK